MFEPHVQPDPDREDQMRSNGARVEIRPAARTAQLAVRSLACPSCEMPVALPDPVSWRESIGCPFCDSWAPTHVFIRERGWPEVEIRAFIPSPSSLSGP